MSAFVRSALLHTLPVLLKSYDKDVDTFLRYHRLRPEWLERGNYQIPFAQVAAAIDHAARLCRQPSIGLHMAATRTLDDIGEFFQLARTAPTALDALRDFELFAPLLSRAMCTRLDIDELAGRARLYFDINLDVQVNIIQVVEYSILLICRILQHATGQSFLPLMVGFRHSPPAKSSIYSRFFNVQVQFRQPLNVIEFSLDTLRQPLPGHRYATYYQLKERLLMLRRREYDFVRDVRNRVRLSIQMDDCSLDTLAASYGWQARTFQRKLAERGLTFSGVQDACRKQLFSEMVLDTRMGLGVISQTLGYANQSSLHKSCLRWFGSTPREMRKHAPSVRC